MENENPFGLVLPEVEHVQYGRNFVDTAVCEIKFPTVLELESKLPPAIHKALRKDFPELEIQRQFEVRDNQASLGNHRFLMRSRKGTWVVAIKCDSVSIETSKYVSFEDFVSRLKKVIDATKPTIDSDFLVRVGLRYINSLRMQESDLFTWLNPCLLAMITSKAFTKIGMTLTEFRAGSDEGNFTIRHGLQPDDQSRQAGQIRYLLDFDFAREDCPVDQLYSFLELANHWNFRLFSWAIGPGAKEYLGTGKPKEDTK